MDNQTRPLHLTDREAQAVFRALLNYETQLGFSMILDTGIVRDEIARVRSVQEKISLTHYYGDIESGDDQ